MVSSDQPNLWTAASDGDLERVQQLIEQGTSANAKDQNGYTAIHAAASWAHPSLLRYLLSKGGDINIADNDGDTPLFTVESVDMCKLVLELGGDPHLHNQAGVTAAQSLQEDHPDISEFLCTLTGEKLPSRTEESSSNDAASADQQAQTADMALDDAQPPQDVMELDPVSRAAAIETNNRAGALLARVQAILLEADRTGEDPEPRIRAIVDEAVNSTVNAGRELATAQVNAVQAEEGTATGAQAENAQETTLPDATGEKRQRTDDGPER